MGVGVSGMDTLQGGERDGFMYYSKTRLKVLELAKLTIHAYEFN